MLHATIRCTHRGRPACDVQQKMHIEHFKLCILTDFGRFYSAKNGQKYAATLHLAIKLSEQHNLRSQMPQPKWPGRDYSCSVYKKEATTTLQASNTQARYVWTVVWAVARHGQKPSTRLHIAAISV